ncbi:MAG: inositol monophosphatase [Holosporales bacterium]|jgi:myo-inositol-1(or 4)-monophosphatase|nr:inositol monophosphatase [Holosporales bacterium]
MSGKTSHLLYIIVKSVEKAASRLVRDFGELEKLQVSRKGFRDFVTSADRNTETRLVYELSQAFPEYSFLCEESGFIERDSKTMVWIVDPIDGTNNFMRGIPVFAINVAMMDNDDVLAGVTYDPMRGDCFKAEKGRGAYLGNRSRIRVSRREQISEAVVAVHVPQETDLMLAKDGAIIRRTGSVALDLAYLAAGKYDAVVAEDVQTWDIASGRILIQEAGGFMEIKKQQESESYDIIAASSSKLLNYIKSHACNF